MIETKEQYNYVERFIKENINDIIKDADTDIEKVFKINEWIRNNVSYDNTYLKYSSYNALNDKSAVCNGYAMLFNRMVTAAGVESVVVIGNSQEKFHAWNAVKFVSVKN